MLVAGGDTALLRDVVVRNVDAVRAVLADLDPDTAGTVRAVLDTVRVLPDAGPEDVPDLLRTPPWTLPRTKPTVVTGCRSRTDPRSTVPRPGCPNMRWTGSDRSPGICRHRYPLRRAPVA
ncbi:hypothetical protein [Tsukamurella sp. PLM1]|uniref:hypothetical protein n=1 Tax=Tsukamurella sp. PLM1 TaxID=2929795 RepID=UPI00204702DB|nr:hypothetical protein [Tsukamurella sp. PLM1]BDH57791.1 hypothetical protein MTP03_27300 [Tsukamurella sp. PLM1]